MKERSGQESTELRELPHSQKAFTTNLIHLSALQDKPLPLLPSPLAVYRKTPGTTETVRPWVNDFLEARDGTYWVATDAGVVQFNPTALSNPVKDRRSGRAATPMFSVLGPENSNEARRVNALAEDKGESHRGWEKLTGSAVPRG